MHRFPIAMAALCLASAAAADVPDRTRIAGNYVEVRSCDVWAGLCFINGEMGLTGQEAILAWEVTRGGWNGAGLKGLRVVAVVRANATLGDTARNPYPARSIVFIDEQADSQQAAALLAFAKDAAGELLGNVIDVRRAPIDMAADPGCAEGRCAQVAAGEDIAIEARCFRDGDKVCGHEDAVYGPLTELDTAMPHFTELSRFTGHGLGVTWDNSGRRSAYIGTFSR